MGLRRVHQSLDDAEGGRVHADTLGRVFDLLARPVAETIPPFVKLASAVGTFEVAWWIKLVVMLTIWREPCFSISVDGALGDVEEAGKLVAIFALKIFRGIFGEGLADEDAGIVDQRVDPAEAPRVAVSTTSLAVFGSAMSPARRVGRGVRENHNLFVTALLNGNEAIQGLRQRLDKVADDNGKDLDRDVKFGFPPCAYAPTTRPRSTPTWIARASSAAFPRA